MEASETSVCEAADAAEEGVAELTKRQPRLLALLAHDTAACAAGRACVHTSSRALHSPSTARIAARCVDRRARRPIRCSMAEGSGVTG